MRCVPGERPLDTILLKAGRVEGGWGTQFPTFDLTRALQLSIGLPGRSEPKSRGCASRVFVLLVQQTLLRSTRHATLNIKAVSRQCGIQVRMPHPTFYPVTEIAFIFKSGTLIIMSERNQWQKDVFTRSHVAYPFAERSYMKFPPPHLSG